MANYYVIRVAGVNDFGELCCQIEQKNFNE